MLSAVNQGPMDVNYAKILLMKNNSATQQGFGSSPACLKRELSQKIPGPTGVPVS